MKSKVTKWGNALGVRIPREACRTLALAHGDSLRIEIVGDKLVMTPEHSDSLSDLLSRVTAENCHGELGWGPDIGRERL